MQKRKTHNKSRRGCNNCKTRHVKCDEQGPPCANCVIRKTTCVYPPSPKAGSSSKLLAPVTRDESTSPSCSSLSVTSPRPSPTVFSSISESDRLLELELMHRWSTRTWTAFYSIPESQEFFQDYLPRLALRHSYLMNGILALAGADLALQSGKANSTSYLRPAVEYCNKATADFRAQASDINPDNIHLLYNFAMMAAIFNFAIPVDHLSAVDRVTMAFTMVLGATQIATVNVNWLVESPDPTAAILKVYRVSLELLDLLDIQTMIAISRLSTVIRKVRLSPRTEEARKAGEQGPMASEIFAYQLAVGQTKYCFAEQPHEHIKGHFWSVISVAGMEFTEGLQAREPAALFVVMYWAVLLDRARLDPMIWFVTSAGRELVREISELLLESPIAELSDVREGIAWTREQVGLPPLEGCSLPDIAKVLEMRALEPARPLYMH